MKFRTKLYISLSIVAISSIILGLVIFSFESEKLVFKILQSRTLSIAATAAARVNPTLFKEANKATSKDAKSFKMALDVLDDMLHANQRSDIYVVRIYTFYPDPENPNILRYAVNTDLEKYLLGAKYPFSDKDLILKNLNQPLVDPEFVGDKEGLWLSAYAPIRDENGNYVATLGVDFDADTVRAQINKNIRFAIYALSSSLIVALLLGYFLSRKVTESLDHLCSVVNEVGEGNLESKAEIESDDEFGTLSETVNDMTKGLQERERIKSSFARYVSKHVMDQILESDTPLKLEGERRKATIMFSDIRQFTLLTQQLSAEEIVLLLNEYFEQMIEVIFSNYGTLDKFIGDGIMAEFGAPIDDTLQEEHAVTSAIQMQKALDKLCDKWAGENKPRIQMGIGIHTGEAVVGNVGSEKRIEYTAIGDSVNVAARLEQATKILKVPILISESTYLACRDKFPFKDLGSMALPGRREQIKVYTIDLEKV